MTAFYIAFGGFLLLLLGFDYLVSLNIKKLRSQFLTKNDGANDENEQGYLHIFSNIIYVTGPFSFIEFKKLIKLKKTLKGVNNEN
jgi:hypothetical protein